MKKIILILISFLSIVCFSQSKTDTLQFVYHQKAYKDKAMSFVKKMIEANVKYGDGRKDLIYDIAELEIIVHPIYEFKKSIKDDNGKTNLMQYINFENNPEKQIFEVYHKGKFSYTYHLPNDKLDEITKGKDIKILVGELSINERPIPYFLNFNYVFKNHFSFYINNKYCVVIDNKLSVISDIAIPLQIKIEPFNNYFFPDLNELKNEAKGKKNAPYSEYTVKNPITPTFLKVFYN